MKMIKLILTASALSAAMAAPAFADTWIRDPARESSANGISNWWYQKTDGTYIRNAWAWIDGNKDGISECYRFDQNGWMYVSTTIDGYTVNESGAWTVDGKTQTRKETIDSERNTQMYDDAGNASTRINSEFYNSHASNLSTFADQCFELVNKEREQAGLDALDYDDLLQEACDVRAEELVDSYSHTRPDGTYFKTAMQEAGLDMDTVTVWGENIAAGFSTPQEAVQAWMNSKTHRDNILKRKFQKSAVGFYYTTVDDYQYFWVQLFTD